MKKKKGQKTEEFIDLFADDEEEVVPAADLFADDEPDKDFAKEPEDLADEEPEEDVADDEPEEELADEEPEEAGEDTPRRETFTFDSHGRRTDRVAPKKRKAQYGKRKHAKRAGTTLLLNETEARREQEAARERAAQRSELRAKQQEKEQRLRREQLKQQAQRQLYALSAVGGLVLLGLAAAYFAFLIRSISVVGSTSRYTQEEIVAASGIKRNRHILFTDLKEARDKLSKDPYLDAQVTYRFPDRVEITVTERRAAGAVAWGPSKEFVAVIDAQGTVLERDADTYAGMPLVQGLIITGALEGNRIGDEADEQVQSMLEVLSALEDAGLSSKIATVDVTETMSISIYTPEGYRIELGDTSDLVTKMHRLKSNYTAIVDRAAQYMSRGADTVTIYLYSKSGVVISPHEVGYVAATPVPISEQVIPEQPNPDTQTQSTPVPYAATFAPQAPSGTPTPPPFNGGGFTG